MEIKSAGDFIKYRVIGIPTSMGALYCGTELGPEKIRSTGLIDLLKLHNFSVDDLGNLKIPEFLPRHSIPPIRHFPGPRIVWQQTVSELEPALRQEGRTLVIGGDCSIVAGTVQAFCNVFADSVFLLYIDGHVDYAVPSADKCSGAAAFGLYLITESNPFWPSPVISKNQISVLGVHNMPADCQKCIPHHTLSDLRRNGIRETAEKTLESISSDMKLMVHLDLDVMNQDSMPAAYSPGKEGLHFDELKELLAVFMADSRVKMLEITEYDGLKDTDGTSAEKVARLLDEVL